MELDIARKKLIVCTYL